MDSEKVAVMVTTSVGETKLSESESVRVTVGELLSIASKLITTEVVLL